jgi:hypothetical protein
MPHPHSLPHHAEALGGASQLRSYGSALPPPTLCIAHRLGQWVQLTRPAAWICQEKGRKMSFVTEMHGTQEPHSIRLCEVFQES